MDLNWKHWRNGIYNFCKPTDVCCIAYCCPISICCLQGQTVSLATGQGCYCPYFMFFLFGCYGAACNRTTIRDKLDIKGSCFDDCLTWCCGGLQALTQERREVELWIKKNQSQGYPPQGYPPQGYPPQGYPPQGYPQPGYPQPGYPPQGIPLQGYPPTQGYPPQGGLVQGNPPKAL